MGDVIVAANGKPIRSTSDMHNLVGLQRIGQTIELKLFRKGNEMNLPVKIQPIEISQIDGGLLHVKLNGAMIGEIREQHLQRGRVDYLQVMEVRKTSNDWDSALRAGDIIYSINKQLTSSFEDAFALVESNDGNMIMSIHRDNRELYIILK